MWGRILPVKGLASVADLSRRHRSGYRRFAASTIPFYGSIYTDMELPASLIYVN
jgi:hypothetical protein